MLATGECVCVSLTQADSPIFHRQVDWAMSVVAKCSGRKCERRVACILRVFMRGIATQESERQKSRNARIDLILFSFFFSLLILRFEHLMFYFRLTTAAVASGRDDGKQETISSLRTGFMCVAPHRRLHRKPSARTSTFFK